MAWAAGRPTAIASRNSGKLPLALLHHPQDRQGPEGEATEQGDAALPDLDREQPTVLGELVGVGADVGEASTEEADHHGPERRPLGDARDRRRNARTGSP